MVGDIVKQPRFHIVDNDYNTSYCKNLKTRLKIDMKTTQQPYQTIKSFEGGLYFRCKIACQKIDTNSNQVSVGHFANPSQIP